MFGRRSKKKKVKDVASDLRKFMNGEDISENLLRDRIPTVTSMIIANGEDDPEPLVHGVKPTWFSDDDKSVKYPFFYEGKWYKRPAWYQDNILIIEPQKGNEPLNDDSNTVSVPVIEKSSNIETQEPIKKPESQKKSVKKRLQSLFSKHEQIEQVSRPPIIEIKEGSQEALKQKIEKLEANCEQDREEMEESKRWMKIFNSPL